MTDIRTLSTEELRQQLDRGDNLQCWNVQTDRFFGGEVIPGSRRVPLDMIEQNADSLSKDAEIITYCGGSTCSQSIQAAQKLSELGYRNVQAYTDGLEGWKAAGYTVQK